MRCVIFQEFTVLCQGSLFLLLFISLKRQSKYIETSSLHVDELNVSGCSFRSPSPATSHQLHHLILIGCDDFGQTAGQQHANQLEDRQERRGLCLYYIFYLHLHTHPLIFRSYLWEGDPKRHSSYYGHVGLHEWSDQLVAALKHRVQVTVQRVQGHVICANYGQNGYLRDYLRELVYEGGGWFEGEHEDTSGVNTTDQRRCKFTGYRQHTDLVVNFVRG